LSSIHRRPLVIACAHAIECFVATKRPAQVGR
jgi:hypothetical protein